MGLHNHTAITGHQMAPHPYLPRLPFDRKLHHAGRTKYCNGMAMDKPLPGLVIEQGKTCLPIEDIIRVQNLVAPAFTSKIKVHEEEGFSENVQKQNIVNYLKGNSLEDEGSAIEGKCAMECNSSGVIPEPPTWINDFSVPLLNQSAVMNDIKDEHQPSIAELNTMLADISSELGLPAPFEEDFLKMKIETIKIETPLSKLEGMKAQLPEVEVNPNDTKMNITPGNPASPASSVSSSSSKDSEEVSMQKKPLVPYNGIGQIRLWQFLIQCLACTEHGICWTNPDAFEFKFTHPEAIARIWGKRKNKAKMTYDKMSRSLRFYYRKNILKKVPDHKHVFQFIDEDVQKVCKKLMKV